MIGTRLLFQLILFVVHSSPDCIQESDSEFARCEGHSFDSLINLGENSLEIRIENSQDAVFVVEKSKNKHLHMIETLDFSLTKTLVILEYGFQDFVSLSELILKDSSIEAVKGTWFLLNNNITNFDCSNNKLRTLLKSDLENLKMLTVADFSYNLLESIEPHTFSEMKELQKLTLSGNQLKSIPIGSLPMLGIIELDHNLIDIVPANIFTAMPKLRLIDLQYNEIRKIEDEAFNGSNSLEYLNLSNNFIEEITEFTISGLSKSSPLAWLDLSSNKISRLASGTFKEMPILRYISFSNNSINELNKDMFEGLDTMALDLNFNEIEIIGDNTFKEFVTLISLFINDNKLVNLTADIFGAPLLSLQVFSIRNNSIRLLDSEFFNFTENIEVLNISSNVIQLLPENIFVPLRRLQYLYMQDNLIEELTEKHIESLQSLKFLSIDHNRLTYIPLNRGSFPNLKEMHIGGNPWQCPCLNEVQDFLKERNITFVKKYYFDGQCPVCMPTYFKHCDKNTNFARWTRIPEAYKNSYTEQCRIKYLNNIFGSNDEESLLNSYLHGYQLSRPRKKKVTKKVEITPITNT